MASEGFNSDFRDFLATLMRTGARFMVIGAHALSAHGNPRATGDLDIWVDPTEDNAERVWAALLDFGAPVQALGVSREDFSTPGMVVQLGLPPRRIDILTEISGELEFSAAWESRLTTEVDGLTLPFLGRRDFVLNKRASGRLKDLADLEAIGELPEPR